MKLDSESPYRNTCSEHAAKVNDHHFIHPKDNHFIVDMLKVNDGAKERKHALTVPADRKSFGESDLFEPHWYVNKEDSVNNINHEGESEMETSYSTPSSEIGLVVKEDFYTDKAVTKVDIQEMIHSIKDASCHKVKDICIDEGVHCLEKSLEESDEVDQKKSCSSNQSRNNGNNYLAREMESAVSPHDLKYMLIDRVPDHVVDKDPEIPVSTDNDSAQQSTDNDSAEQSIDDEKLDTNGNNDLTREMPSIASSHDLEYSLVDRVPDTIVDKDTEIPISNNNESAEQYPHESSTKNGDSLDKIGKNGLRTEMMCIASSHDLKYTLVDRVPDTVVDRDPEHLRVSTDDDFGEKCSSESPTKDGEKLHTTGLSAEKVCEKRSFPSLRIETDLSKVESSRFICSDSRMQFIDKQKIDQGRLEEGSSTSAVISPSTRESNQANGAMRIPANNCKEVPSGVIVFNFDSGAASTSGREEHKDIVGSQLFEQAHKGTGIVEAALDGATDSARGSFLQHAHGDFETAFLSGPIVNSGRIPYSGNISMRSDSSTTSARSFAFPILQSEWNSSPVKMAKADRRQLRKQRGWKMGLLCCRF